jgi:GTP cyclohydrolase I
MNTSVETEKTFQQLNFQQKKFVVILEWFMALEKFTDEQRDELLSDPDRIEEFADRMFEKWDKYLTEETVNEMVLLRNFGPIFTTPNPRDTSHFEIRHGVVS